ncbi:MAG: hypothetical protein A4E67_01172 [Syntrophaceae bacterium PtaB.Bin038]|nr:MAG: hypothetical protein A4E67_01172 [Syntrophaceae bacterium PtaB.Bin038]
MEEHGVALLPGGDGAVADREPRVGHDEVLVEEDPGAEPVTLRARPVGAVEGEHPRRQLREAHVAVGAGVALAEEDLAAPGDSRADEAVGEAGRDLQGIAQALADALADGKAVDDHVDVVAPVAVQGDLVGEVPDFAVHPHAHVALAPQAGELALKLPLLAADDRGHEGDGRSLRQRQELLHHGVDRLRADLAAAPGAVGHADPRVEQAQVIVDLRDGPHGGAGVVARAALLDRDGGGEPLDGFHLGLVHLADELAGVGRQRLDVAPLPLGVDRVEGQRGFARPAHAGDDDEAVPGDVEADVPEVVLRRTLDADEFHRDSNPPLSPVLLPWWEGEVEEGETVPLTSILSRKGRGRPGKRFPCGDERETSSYLLP